MADKPKVKPSSAGVWIGLVMMLLSFASCGAGCVLAGSEIKDAADAAQRVDVPASQTYDMEADAAGIIIGLAPSASDAKDIEVSLTDENGTAVEVSTSSSFSSSTTESKGDSVEVLGTFEVKKAGTYTLNATGPAGTRVAILNISIGAILGKFFGGIGIGLVLFLVGLILAIVTGVRRSRAKKKAATVGSFGAPPPGGGFPGQVPPAPGAPGQIPAPGQVPPAPQGYPQQAPPAPAFPPAAPPAPGGFPPAPPAPAAYPPPGPPPPYSSCSRGAVHPAAGPAGSCSPGRPAAPAPSRPVGQRHAATCAALRELSDRSPTVLRAGRGHSAPPRFASVHDLPSAADLGGL